VTLVAIAGTKILDLTQLKDSLDYNEIGHQMYDLIFELYPICRSLTGDGVRETLEIIKSIIPINNQEIPTDTKVYDWTIPREWNIKDAYIKNSNGERVVDFRKTNLHVVSYSVPVKKRLTFEEMKDHLYTIPEHPDWIPYRHTYYKEDWGFCLSHKQFLSLEREKTYDVLIDSSLLDGFLTLGECYLKGESEDEILISTHICHPSLCNDNLSGIAVAVFLAKYLSSIKRKHSFRIIFAPTTIGSITWLALNEPNISNVKHGLVLANLGDSGGLTYKRSRQNTAEIDKAAENISNHCPGKNKVISFSPFGYDERQYCSPGFNLPVGTLMRTPHGQYPEYHTSADNLELIKPHSLRGSLFRCIEIINILEKNNRFLNMSPNGEPQLGRRGLYKSIQTNSSPKTAQMAVLWVLNLSDGNHSLLDIAERADMSFVEISKAAHTLIQTGLLKKRRNRIYLSASEDGQNAGSSKRIR